MQRRNVLLFAAGLTLLVFLAVCEVDALNVGAGTNAIADKLHSRKLHKNRAKRRGVFADACETVPAGAKCEPFEKPDMCYIKKCFPLNLWRTPQVNGPYRDSKGRFGLKGGLPSAQTQEEAKKLPPTEQAKLLAAPTQKQIGVWDLIINSAKLTMYHGGKLIQGTTTSNPKLGDKGEVKGSIFLSSKATASTFARLFDDKQTPLIYKVELPARVQFFLVNTNNINMIRQGGLEQLQEDNEKIYRDYSNVIFGSDYQLLDSGEKLNDYAACGKAGKCMRASETSKDTAFFDIICAKAADNQVHGIIVWFKEDWQEVYWCGKKSVQFEIVEGDKAAYDKAQADAAVLARGGTLPAQDDTKPAAPATDNPVPPAQKTTF